MSGAKAIIDGGSLVVPVVHEIVWVSLQTMTLEVKRSGKEALLTNDKIRADITAEFFIKVPKNKDSVVVAATSLGVGAVNKDTIKTLLEKKLESAIRQVAAEMPIQELMVNRADFIHKVSEHVKPDLAKNGLELETVTISYLDQTEKSGLRPNDNVFDAQGEQKMAEIISAAKVQANQYNLDAERKIKQEQVRTNEFVYEREVANATAAAERDRKIKIVQALANQEAATQAAQQAQLAGLAEIQKDQALQLAEVEQAQAVDVASQARERATRTAEIAKQQALEVAEREKSIAIALKEKERADAEAAQLAAEAERTRQDQAVKTVEITATAERQKAQTVINAQAQIDKTRLEKQMQVEVDAFAVVKKAEAEQVAADRQATARLTLAKADKDAKTLEAEAAKANQMVPVDVDRAQVEVERARVEVGRSELQNKAEFESIASELQVKLAQIDAAMKVAMAQAEALGSAYSKANITIWGDPGTMERMSRAFLNGQQSGLMLEGLSNGTPQEIKDTVGSAAAMIAAFLQSKLGIALEAKQVEELLKMANSQKEKVS